MAKRMATANGWRKRQIMIKEPEDEAFDDLEKAQQRRLEPTIQEVQNAKENLALMKKMFGGEPLLVDKGCAERGCMGYDDRDGDKPVKMRVFDDDDIQEYKKPWRGLTHEEVEEVWEQVESSDFLDCVHPFARAIETKLKGLNS
jgi:hypothetical protein